MTASGIRRRLAKFSDEKPDLNNGQEERHPPHVRFSSSVPLGRSLLIKPVSACKISKEQHFARRTIEPLASIPLVQLPVSMASGVWVNNM